MTTRPTTTTDNPDLMAYAAAKAGRAPVITWDRALHHATATIPADIAARFYVDAELQEYLRCKRAVWREMQQARGRG